MKKHLLHAVATAAVLLTLTTGAQAQNLAIVNGKAVPKTRMDADRKSTRLNSSHRT